MQDRVQLRLLAATALAHLLFAIWPLLDITVSGLFLQADGSFWLAKSAAAESLRKPIWLASFVLAVFAALMLCITLARGANAQTPMRFWLFVTALYVSGPGLLVNALLKQNWGRARPDAIVEFGGNKLFSPPFEIAGQCSSNCSFVSGEAASAAVLVMVIAVCFARSVSKPWRGAVFIGLAALFMLASGMRVASGRHFLSDVVFAGLFMLIIARICYRVFGVIAPDPGNLLRLVQADIASAASLIFPPIKASNGVVPTPDATPPPVEGSAIVLQL